MHRMMIIIAALLFSTAGAAIKSITLSGFQVASFRSLVAVIFFVLSNKLTTAANSIFLQSASPLYIMLLGPLFLKEKIKSTDLFLILPIVTGMMFLFAGTSAGTALSSNPILGNILACSAGVCWAMLIMGL